MSFGVIEIDWPQCYTKRFSFDLGGLVFE